MKPGTKPGHYEIRSKIGAVTSVRGEIYSEFSLVNSTKREEQNRRRKNVINKCCRKKPGNAFAWLVADSHWSPAPA
jgi:hypothetical protein